MKNFTQLTEQSNEEIIAIYLDFANNFVVYQQVEVSS